MADSTGILGELARLDAREREAAAFEYSRLLLQRGAPAVGDAAKLKRAADLLGRSVADVQRDADALARIEADALEAAALADRHAACEAVKRAYHAAAERSQALRRKLEAADQAFERVQGNRHQAITAVSRAIQAEKRRLEAARRWWSALGVSAAPGGPGFDVLHPNDESNAAPADGGGHETGDSADAADATRR